MVAVVLAAFAGIVALGVITSAGKRQEVGDCVFATGGSAKTGDFEVVDCASPEATYRIAVEADASCESNTYGQWLVSGYKGADTLYCLTLNASEGDCFHQTIGFPTGKATKVECGSAASYRVVATHTGVSDADTCGDDVLVPSAFDATRPMALVYPEPPLTICTDGA